MKRILLIFVTQLFVLQLMGQTNITPIRIALLNFVSEDNSYRSTVAMENLTSLLQAEISPGSDYDWVERAELTKVTDEFRLAGLGVIDRSEAIRSGRWVKADWGIFGDVSTNFNNQRQLTLEVVNLQRADVLVETNLSLPSNENGPFQAKPEESHRIATCLKTLLDQARNIYVASEKQDAVAFLYLSLSQTMPDDDFDGLEANFRQLLLNKSAQDQRFHMVQFQRAGAAMDEASLVLSGLAETDSNAWEKVADHYVWGETHLDNTHFDWNTREYQKILNIKLYVWDGRSEPQTITLTVTNETSGIIAKKLMEAVIPRLQRVENKPVIENIRKQISDSVLAHYVGLPMNFWFSTPKDRQQWFDAVQLLETACFFDPANAAAREQLLRLRWGSALADSDAGKVAARIEKVSNDPSMLSLQLKSASHNEFFFVRRRSDAWKKYVEQFGLTSALKQPGRSSIASEYVLSAWRPFEMFDYAVENRTAWGVPRDAGVKEITAWKNQFGSDFASRLLEIPSTPAFQPRSWEFFYHCLDIPDLKMRTRMVKEYWPWILEQAKQNPIGFSDSYRYLRKYFEDIGQPGGDEKLLAQLTAANQEASARQVTNAPAKPVHLPRMADLEPALTGDIFSLPPMAFPIPLIQPDIKKTLFPTGTQVKGINAMAYHDHALWLAVGTVEPVQIRTVNSQIEKEFQPATAEHTRLWKLDLSSNELKPVTGPLATNDINNLMFRGDTLWLALGDDGIAALNVKTGDLQRYEPSGGIVAANQFTLRSLPHGIAALGGMADLIYLDDAAKTWTAFTPPLPHQNFSYGGALRQAAVLNERLLLYNSQMWLCDFKSNNWTTLASPQTWDQVGRINFLTSDDRKNFWITTDSGLHDINPDTGKIHSQWVSLSPTVKTAKDFQPFGQPKSFKPDTQLIREIREKLQARRQMLDARKADTNQPNLFIPDSRLGSAVCSVASDHDFLWVFTMNCTSPLLYQPASHKWVGGLSIQNFGVPSPTTSACSEGKLWLATQIGHDYSILEIDSSALESTPRERWLPDDIAKTELGTRISSLTEHERAVYYFFSGDDPAAIKLLKSQPEDTLDAESLFLLYHSLSEIGETNQAVQFEQKLMQEFSDSIFAQTLASDQRNLKMRSTIAGRFTVNPRPESMTRAAFVAWMLHNCDFDGDGTLDIDELTVFFELNPEQIQPFVFNSMLKPAAAAAAVLQRGARRPDTEGLNASQLLGVTPASLVFPAYRHQSHTNSAVHINRIQP